MDEVVPGRSERTRSRMAVPRVGSVTSWSRPYAAHKVSNASPAGVVLLLLSQAVLCTLKSPVISK